MAIIKLEKKHMLIADSFLKNYKEKFDIYDFNDTFLSGLDNFHSYAYLDSNGNCNSLIAFYESSDDASWYCTTIASTDYICLAKLFDAILELNESKGRNKFYCLVNSIESSTSYPYNILSQQNLIRYMYYDEFKVSAKTQCIFNLPWQILFGRKLLSETKIVRCICLKQEFRVELFDAGRL